MRVLMHWRCLAVLVCCVFGLFIPSQAAQRARVEHKFDMLQIGTQTYTNVTVTSLANDYIFILHSAGMANIKVEELPQELLLKFGYIEPPKPQTNSVSTWAKDKMGAIQTPEVVALQESIMAQTAPAVERFISGGPVVFAVAGSIGLLLYAFSAYCCMLICKKTGNQPGILVWVPVFNLIPLLRAAGMSPAWFLGFLVPVLNLVPYIIWCFKIVQARGKQAWTALLLILPVTSPFMMLYLAFSSGAEPKAPKERAPQMMTLETV